MRTICQLKTPLTRGVRLGLGFCSGSFCRWRCCCGSFCLGFLFFLYRRLFPKDIHLLALDDTLRDKEVIDRAGKLRTFGEPVFYALVLNDGVLGLGVMGAKDFQGIPCLGAPGLFKYDNAKCRVVFPSYALKPYRKHAGYSIRKPP